jgi:dolichol-phosphate mannosyltransferase
MRTPFVDEGARMACVLDGNLEINSRVGVILPTYCEAQNIQRIIAEIQALHIDTAILVIDDSSPDGTAELVKSLQEHSPNLLLIVRPQKRGLGSAITDGFRAFLSLRNIPEFVVTMDADYSHNPADLPRIVSRMKGGCDLVVGSRYCAGGKTEGWPLMRKIISRGANAIARGVLGLRLRDCTSGYRCYSTTFLRKTIGFLHSQTYDIQIETVKQARTQGFQVREVPILFVNRKQGKSKLSLIEIENYVSYIFKTVALRKNR